MGKPVFIAGWGDTVPGYCTPSGNWGALRVGLSSISYVDCNHAGRRGIIGLAPAGFCDSQAPPCVANAGKHDSGGGVIVELPDQSLGVVGVMEYPSLASIAARHQVFTATPGAKYVCRPCRPRACGDVNGDGIENCDDRDCLEALEPWEVNPWCLGDLDGDGVAGAKSDLPHVNGCSPGDPDHFRVCDRNQWCYGDANLDGYVTLDDLELIELARASGTNGTYLCPLCHACLAPLEWCRGDINLDLQVDAQDASIVAGLINNSTNQSGYRCFQGAPGCEPPLECPTEP